MTKEQRHNLFSVGQGIYVSLGDKTDLRSEPTHHAALYSVRELWERDVARIASAPSDYHCSICGKQHNGPTDDVDVVLAYRADLLKAGKAGSKVKINLLDSIGGRPQWVVWPATGKLLELCSVPYGRLDYLHDLCQAMEWEVVGPREVER